MSSKKYTAEELTHAREMLETYVPRGSRVYGVVRSVAASGQSRVMDFYAVHNGELAYLSGYIAKVLDLSRSSEGLRIRGYGMDMLADTVHSLGLALYQDGYALKYDRI